MDVATYVKYDLVAKTQSSFQKYRWHNILWDPINHILTDNMCTATARYIKRLQQKRAETRTQTLQYRPTSLMTKKIAPKMKKSDAVKESPNSKKFIVKLSML